MDFTFSSEAKATLEKLGCGVVYLIGSRATENYRQNSDFDFAVVMKDKAFLQGKRELYDRLYVIFNDEIPKVEVDSSSLDNLITLDIVFLQTAPLYYSIEARNNGKVIFQISEEFRLNFEEQATREYMDFEPFRKEQERVTLTMI